MTEPLQRGSVVLCGDRYGVVWEVRGPDLVLLPVVKPRGPARAGDVELGLAELVAAGIAVPDARIQAGQPIVASAEGQVMAGALQGRILCRVVLAVARAFADANIEDRWDHERRHRAEAQSTRSVRI